MAVSGSAHALLSHFPILTVPTLLYSWDAGRGRQGLCLRGHKSKSRIPGEQSGLKGSVLLELSAALSPGATQIEQLFTALPVCSSPDLCVSPPHVWLNDHVWGGWQHQAGVGFPVGWAPKCPARRRRRQRWVSVSFPSQGILEGAGHCCSCWPGATCPRGSAVSCFPK